MSNVKVGDRIRPVKECVYAGCSVGDVLTVESVHPGRGFGTGVTAVKYIGQAPLYFYGTEYEVIPETAETELGRLVRVANEGYSACLVLNTISHQLEENVAGEGWRAYTEAYPIELRIKPKPAFEPFYVGKKTCCGYDPVTKSGGAHSGPCTSGEWLVKLEGDTLHVGCKTFDAQWAKRALTGVPEGQSGYVSALGSLKPTRTGIRVGQYELSWADADRILAALEKAGV